MAPNYITTEDFTYKERGGGGHSIIVIWKVSVGLITTCKHNFIT